MPKNLKVNRYTQRFGVGVAGRLRRLESMLAQQLHNVRALGDFPKREQVPQSRNDYEMSNRDRQAEFCKCDIDKLMDAIGVWSEESKIKFDEEAARSALRHAEVTDADGPRHEELRFRLEEIKIKLDEMLRRFDAAEQQRPAANSMDDKTYEALTGWVKNWELWGNKEREWHDQTFATHMHQNDDFRFRLEELKVKIEEEIERSTLNRAQQAVSNDIRYEDIRFRLEEIKLRNQETAHRSRLTLRTDLWTPDQAQAFRNTFRLLNPFDVSGHEMRRVGREHDGGYVMIDDLQEVTAALSLGINDDDSWDVDLARRQIPVFQFDHTVEASPTAHDLFFFHKRRVTVGGAEGTVTLSDLIRERVDNGCKRLILKMDIESDEWDVIDATPISQLSLISQLVCEFHDLENVAYSDFHKLVRRCFAKLHEVFFVCHVHGNNSGPITVLGNIPLPGTLEVTFANRAFYAPEESLKIFPTSLDSPNHKGRADLHLGSFRF